MQKCGDSYSGELANISSPNYPDNYTVRSECIYLIRVPDAKAIRLTFYDFSTETEKDSFEYGIGASVDYKHKLGTFSGRLSGSYLPDPVTLHSNQVWILFLSDRSAVDRGWFLEYSAGWYILFYLI